MLFLSQRIVLDSYTSSCSLSPCFGLFMICPYSAQQRRYVVHWQLFPALIRSLGMNDSMSADIILLLFAFGEGLVVPLTQTSRGHFDSQYRSSSSPPFGRRCSWMARSISTSCSSTAPPQRRWFLLYAIVFLVCWFTRLPQVHLLAHLEVHQRSWSPWGGREEMAMAWPGCMLHQMLSLSSVPEKSMRSMELPAKTQLRILPEIGIGGDS